MILSQNPNPSLPDDLIVSCLARVSRLYYPLLSLVSKRFRSIIASKELHETRSSLGNTTDTCIYFCLRYYYVPDQCRWFTLCCKTDHQTLTRDTSSEKKKSSSGYVEISTTKHDPRSGRLVALGSNIYYIGLAPSGYARLSILDCRSNMWREGSTPRLVVTRNDSLANVVDGKIYVVGRGFHCPDILRVFDPKTQVWEVVASPQAQYFHRSNIEKSAGVDGCAYLLAANTVFVYKGKWNMVHVNMDKYPYCVIQNVLYYFHEGELKWYDLEERLWRKLNGVNGGVKGLEGLVKLPKCRVKLADYGGKMAVLWVKTEGFSGRDCENKMIMCTVVALERRNSEEIWGKVEWFDEVLKIPSSYDLEYALASTFS